MGDFIDINSIDDKYGYMLEHSNELCTDDLDEYSEEYGTCNILDKINEKDIKLIIKIMKKSDQTKDFLLMYIDKPEQIKVMIDQGFILTTNDVYKYFLCTDNSPDSENDNYSSFVSWDDSITKYKRQHTIDGIDNFKTISSRIIKMVDHELVKDIKLLNILIKTCPDLLHDYILDLLNTIDPNQKTLDIFLQQNCKSDVMFKKLFKQNNGLKLSDVLFMNHIINGNCPFKFIQYLINNNILDDDRITRELLYRHHNYSDDLLFLIYEELDDDELSYSDMLYVCQSGYPMLKSINYLISKNIYPDYKCVIESIKAGYDSDFGLILKHTSDESIIEGQIEITNIINEYGSFQDVYPLYYVPLLLEKGFIMSPILKKLIEMENISNGFIEIDDIVSDPNYMITKKKEIQLEKINILKYELFLNDIHQMCMNENKYPKTIHYSDEQKTLVNENDKEICFTFNDYVPNHLKQKHKELIYNIDMRNTFIQLVYTDEQQEYIIPDNSLRENTVLKFPIELLHKNDILILENGCNKCNETYKCKCRNLELSYNETDVESLKYFNSEYIKYF
jgi:hypothetical protein